MSDSDLTIIGWRELVHLPEWGVHGIWAKADTGARSSAIDVTHIEELPEDRVRFEVAASRRGDGVHQIVEAAIARRSQVRSSLGDAHQRIFVHATLELAGHRVDTELGLVSRESMISRLLIGRRTLEGIFLVDSGRQYLHGRPRRQPRITNPLGETAHLETP